MKLFPAPKKGRWGYISGSGEFVIDPIYDSAGYFSEGVAWVRCGNSYSLIAADGQICTESSFGKIGIYSEGFCPAVTNDGDFGYLDTSLKFRVVPGYSWGYCFSEGVASVRNGDVYDYISTEFVVVASGNQYPHMHSNGVICFWKDGTAQWGYLNSRGGWEIAAGFSHAYRFSEGLAAVVSGHGSKRKMGYIDKSGDYKIDPSFESIPDPEFSEGLAPFLILNKGREQSGYIDLNGEIVFELRCDLAGPFREGMAFVENGRDRFFVNREGKRVSSVPISLAEPFRDGLAFASYEGRWGYIGVGGDWVYQDT